MHDEASRSTCNLTFALEKGVSKGKFDPRSVECILVGYAATSKAYRLYVPERRKVIVSNDVKVLKIRQDNLEADPSEDTPQEPTISAQRRGRGRPKTLRSGFRGRPRKIYQQPNTEQNNGDDADSEELQSDEPYEECEIANALFDDPVNIAEAKSPDDADNWITAIEDEFMAHLKNKTRDIVEQPDDRKALGKRMVFRTNHTGSEEYKKMCVWWLKVTHRDQVRISKKHTQP